MPGPHGFVGKHQHPMNMVWHDHKRIQFHFREVAWNLIPAARHRLTRVIAHHFPVQNRAEEVGVAARADRHEVGAGLCVIVVGER